MSLDTAEDFMRRAEEHLMVARMSLERGFYNAAAINAEMAAQLAVKALLIRLGVEPPRMLDIRALLDLVISKLGGDAAEEVRDFMSNNRRDLIILENSGGLDRCGAPRIDRDRAEIALKTAESIVKLVRRLWNL